MSVGSLPAQPSHSARWSHERFAEARWTRSLGVQLLVVDPDEEDGDLSVRLRAEGVSVTWCVNALDSLVQFGRLDPDAVIITPALRGLSAYDLVATMKRHDARLLLIGLDEGAADSAGSLFLAGATAAIARPYDAHDVMGRLVAHMSHLDSRARVTFGEIELDSRAYEVRVAGLPLKGLPLKEFELLRVLMLHGNHVVANNAIREALWGSVAHAPSSNAIAVYAGRLRTRLGDHARVTRVRGIGYRLSHD